jgi:hypothetical protein
MKKAILIFAASVTIASCSNGSNGTTIEATNDSTMVCDSTTCDSTICDSVVVDTTTK